MRDRFAIVDALLRAFPADLGFEPYSFATFAYTPGFLRAIGPSKEVRRSFRYERTGCCVDLELEAPPTSQWARTIATRLSRAGYSRPVHFPSGWYRRYLLTAAHRRSELAFLADLGMNGEPERWPTRTATSQPKVVPRRRSSHAQWLRVVDEVRRASVDWDDAVIGLSRYERLAAPLARGSIGVTVGVIGWNDREQGARVELFAAANPLRSKHDAAMPLPPRVAAKLRDVLRSCGFEPDGARSPRTGKAIRGRVGYMKRIMKPAAAPNECMRILATLRDTKL